MPDGFSVYEQFRAVCHSCTWSWTSGSKTQLAIEMNDHERFAHNDSIRETMADEYDQFADVPWCSEVGKHHDWSGWELSQFYPPREGRFCSVCGGMETQAVGPDNDSYPESELKEP